MFQMVRHQSEVGLVPHDTSLMLTFYRDVIGLQVHSETPIAGAVNRRFLCGETVVKLLCLDEPPPLGVKGVFGQYGLRKLYLVLADFDAAVARLAAAGMEAAVNQGRALRYCNIEDPEGNALELVGLDEPREAGATVQLGVTVADLKRSRRFYEELLGREFVGVRDWKGREVMVVKWGPAELKFWQGPEGLTRPPPVSRALAGIRYLTALVDDVEGICATLKTAGVEMPMPPRLWEGRATIAYIADPDGVLIEFGGPIRPDRAQG